MYARIRTASYQIIRMRYHYHWRIAVVGILCGMLGLSVFSGTSVGYTLTTLALLAMLGESTNYWIQYVALPQSSKSIIARREERNKRSKGMASLLDIAELTSPTTLRLQGRWIRPIFWSKIPWWKRLCVTPTSLGVKVASIGYGLWGQNVWSTFEEATLRIGGPRQGKTTTLIPYGENAPGALITTSTRLDIAEALHKIRLRNGPVHIFNPTNLGGVPSTVHWRILTGCEDFDIANQRAIDLIPISVGERAVWDDHARRLLGLFLFSAAASGRSVRDVIRWSSGRGENTKREVIEGIKIAGGIGTTDRVEQIELHWSKSDRFTSSISSMIALALAWMSSDTARQMGDADKDDPGLVDLKKVILHRETLHLIGKADDGIIAPLISAFIAEIVRTVRYLASYQISGKLDPPVMMLLDEAAIVTHIPLHQWTADLGGFGVSIHISLQSIAQARGKWGNDADTLLGNIGCLIVFGGSPLASDLTSISTLAGKYLAQIPEIGRPTRVPNVWEQVKRFVLGIKSREDTYTYAPCPVVSEADIKSLLPGQVLVLHRSLPPVIGWAPSVVGRKKDKWQASLPRTQSEADTQATQSAMSSRASVEAVQVVNLCKENQVVAEK